jgi:hypothetical protein
MNWFQKLLCSWFKIGCPTPPPEPPPTVSRTGLLFGYFGGGSSSEFADHCNVQHIGSWGDWSTAGGREAILSNFIGTMAAAKAAGINRVIITVDWCLWSSDLTRLPELVARSYLLTFFDAIMASGMGDMVTALYVVDEPDKNGISDVDMKGAVLVLRHVMQDYPWKNAPLQVTYGDGAGKGGALPGVSVIDWAGFDNYGSPIFTNGEYNSFVSRLSPPQRTVLFPGGSTPWRQDPLPFYNKAQQDTRVAFIMPFMWFTNGDNGGIRDDGMAPQYVACGKPIKVANP